MTAVVGSSSRPAFLDEAEAEKMRAEAEAELVKARAEAAKHEAEARKLAAEAEAAEHAAVEAKIKREKAEHARNVELAGDEFNHRYNFIGGVDGAACQKCMDRLTFWSRTEEPTKLEIVFFSPGGSVFAGMALFDHILGLREQGWHVTTTAKGYAASMGGILVQAGDVRAMGRESYLHIHEVAAGVGGKTSEIEDEVALMKKMESRVVDIFASRSKLSKSIIRTRMKRREWWIDSTEALKVGLVDKIV